MAPPPPKSKAMAVFERLFEDHFDYVWNALRRLGVTEAEREDLAQEVFVRVHRTIATYDPNRPPRPWLFAFAFRVASDHRRRARHRVEVLGDTFEAASDALPADANLDDVRRRAHLMAALDRLDDDRRAILVLHEIEEIPIPEVARVLEIPEGTAYTRLRAGRAELARILKDVFAKDGEEADR